MQLIPVAPLAALDEGDCVAAQVAGREVLVCMVEGRLFALENRCPHAGVRLSGGRLDGWDVVCPGHLARFDVRSGAVTRGPAAEAIQTFPALVEGGKVCVGIRG